MEQLDYDLLFRWFVGLAMDAPVWDASSFSKNRNRRGRWNASGGFAQILPAEAGCGQRPATAARFARA